MASSSNLRGWRSLGTCKLELRTSWLLRVPLDWVPWGLSLSLSWPLIVPSSGMQNNAAAAISQTKDTKNEAHKIPLRNLCYNKEQAALFRAVPTKSGGTSVYDDSPKEPLLNKLLNITAGFQLFPRSHPRICGISPLILSFNPCAEWTMPSLLQSNPG